MSDLSAQLWHRMGTVCSSVSTAAILKLGQFTSQVRRTTKNSQPFLLCKGKLNQIIYK